MSLHQEFPHTLRASFLTSSNIACQMWTEDMTHRIVSASQHNMTTPPTTIYWNNKQDSECNWAIQKTRRH
jgi:ribosomal protein L18